MRVFDAHFHIVDPDFPLIENQGFRPQPYTVADYRDEVGPLDVAGGAVVSGSFQGFDQTYLLAALTRLGPGFVGVTQLPEDVPAPDVLRLHDAGVRAVRFNLRRGGSAGLASLETMARRVHEIAGWHVEIYSDARDLAGCAAMLTTLPKVSIDHLGLAADGLPVLLRLVESGAKVKATGFGRISGDIARMLRSISAADPAALMFGTDLPSTRTRRFTADDVALIADTLGEAQHRAVFRDNAARFYGVSELRQG